MLDVYFICYKQSLYMSLGAHVYFFRLDIKLFFSPQSPTYSLIRPDIPQSLIFCFHFSRNMAHSKCQIWPWTWMIISIQNIWLTSTGISKQWLLPRKKEERTNGQTDIRNGLEVLENGRRLTVGSFSPGHSVLSVFNLFEEKIHVGNALWNKTMRPRDHKSAG